MSTTEFRTSEKNILIFLQKSVKIPQKDYYLRHDMRAFFKNHIFFASFDFSRLTFQKQYEKNNTL